MCPIKYYDILKDSANPFNIRIRMVQYCLKYGISSTAVAFGTTRDTVRKWKRAYLAKGTKGLINKSRAPHNIPHKADKSIEEEILRHREVLPSWGPIRLKDDFNIPISTTAIYRVLKQNKRIKKYKRKYQIKKDLTQIKLQLKAFQKIQIDVKDLSDIPNYYKNKKLFNLPRYQFTARDVKSGMLYIAYARKNYTRNAANFLELLCKHLKEHGIDLKNVSVQTDNGVEFIGSYLNRKKSTFTYLAEEVYCMKHYRTPPRCCTFNSDVESSHLRIEKDFYDLEDFNSTQQLSIKAYTYMLYFNLIRKNRKKLNKTSYELVKDDYPELKPTICAISAVVMDDEKLYYADGCWPISQMTNSVDDVPYHSKVMGTLYG